MIQSHRVGGVQEGASERCLGFLQMPREETRFRRGTATSELSSADFMATFVSLRSRVSCGIGISLQKGRHAQSQLIRRGQNKGGQGLKFPSYPPAPVAEEPRTHVDRYSRLQIRYRRLAIISVTSFFATIARVARGLFCKEGQRKRHVLASLEPVWRPGSGLLRLEVAPDGLDPSTMKMALLSRAHLMLPDVGASVALPASPLSRKLIHDTVIGI